MLSSGKKEDLSYTPLRLPLAFMSRCCLLFYQCAVQKKTYPALLFDSLWRLCPHVVFSFTSAKCKKDNLFCTPLRLYLAFMPRCCLLFYQCNGQKKKTYPTLLFNSLWRLWPDVVFSFTSAIGKKEDLSYTPLLLSFVFMARYCLLFYQCNGQKRRLILHSSSTLFGVSDQMLSFLYQCEMQENTFPACTPL